MEACPQCGGTFPAGSLVDVIIQRGGRVTRQMMCEPCGLAATKGLNQMMLHGQDAADLVHRTGPGLHPRQEEVVAVLDMTCFSASCPSDYRNPACSVLQGTSP